MKLSSANKDLVAMDSSPRGKRCSLSSRERAGVPVGEATFWLIGRGDSQDPPATAHFGLVDEASKLNLNTATTNMLLALPRMTPELAANIVSWRSSANTNPSGGAESDTYLRL